MPPDSVIGGSGAAVPDARKGGLFSQAWMKKHWVELMGLVAGLVVLLYLWSRSRSSASTAGYALPGDQTAAPAAPGAGGSGPGQGTDLSPVLAALTGQQQTEQAGFQGIMDAFGKSQDAQASALTQLAEQQQASAQAQSESEKSMFSQFASAFTGAISSLQQGQQQQASALASQQQQLLQAIAAGQGTSQQQAAWQAQLASMEGQIAQLLSRPTQAAPYPGAPGGTDNPTPGFGLPPSQPSLSPPSFGDPLRDMGQQVAGLFQGLTGAQIQSGGPGYGPFTSAGGAQEGGGGLFISQGPLVGMGTSAASTLRTITGQGTPGGAAAGSGAAQPQRALPGMGQSASATFRNVGRRPGSRF